MPAYVPSSLGMPIHQSLSSTIHMRPMQSSNAKRKADGAGGAGPSKKEAAVSTPDPQLAALLSKGNVFLACSDGEVRAHRDMLAIASPVLEGLLEAADGKKQPAKGPLKLPVRGACMLSWPQAACLLSPCGSPSALCLCQGTCLHWQLFPHTCCSCLMIAWLPGAWHWPSCTLVGACPLAHI